MLKQRIITASILAAVVLAAVLVMPPAMFAVLLLLVVALAAWEWSNLSGLNTRAARFAYTAAVIVVNLVSYWLLQTLNQSFLVYLLSAACIGWLVCLVLVKTYPSSVELWYRKGVCLLMGLLVLVPAGVAFVSLHATTHGKVMVVILIATVAAADIGAYFAGKRFGRRKLAPRVSPGKTIEGLVGGVIAAMIFLALVLCSWISYPVTWALGVGALAALISVVGDLFESTLKRQRGIKDSGTLLPGHGGILDRIDGLLAAAPVFVLAMVLTGGAV